MSTVRDCDYPWTGFMIWSNGSASCCCYGSTAVGDVSKASPESVWNNATMQSLRASVSAGVVHTVCQSGTCKYVVGSRASEPAALDWSAAPADFDETWYIAQYFDVAVGVGKGLWSSGLEHYRRYGYREFRFTNGRAKNRSLLKQQQKAQSLSPGYRATLGWFAPARIRDGRIVMNVSAENSGSIPWRPKGHGPTPIQACVESYRRLEDVHQTRPMYAYRADLTGPVEPGQTIAFEVHAPLDDFPIGSSFLVVDLGSDEKAMRFTGGATKPLVLGVHRDEWTDDIELVQG